MVTSGSNTNLATAAAYGRCLMTTSRGSVTVMRRMLGALGSPPVMAQLCADAKCEDHSSTCAVPVIVDGEPVSHEMEGASVRVVATATNGGPSSELGDSAPTIVSRYGYPGPLMVSVGGTARATTRGGQRGRAALHSPDSVLHDSVACSCCCCCAVTAHLKEQEMVVGATVAHVVSTLAANCAESSQGDPVQGKRLQSCCCCWCCSASQVEIAVRRTTGSSVDR